MKINDPIDYMAALLGKKKTRIICLCMMKLLWHFRRKSKMVAKMAAQFPYYKRFVEVNHKNHKSSGHCNRNNRRCSPYSCFEHACHRYMT